MYHLFASLVSFSWWRYPLLQQDITIYKKQTNMSFTLVRLLTRLWWHSRFCNQKATTSRTLCWKVWWSGFPKAVTCDIFRWTSTGTSSLSRKWKSSSWFCARSIWSSSISATSTSSTSKLFYFCPFRKESVESTFCLAKSVILRRLTLEQEELKQEFIKLPFETKTMN